MEAIVVDAIIESVIIAVRKDLIKCLTETECCKWSKRRINKLLRKLQKVADDEQSIEEAKYEVRKSIAHLSPPSSIQSGSLRDLEIDPHNPPILQSYKENKSIIHDFVKKLTLI